MTFDVTQSRVGLLLAPTTTVWTGTVSSYNSAAFAAIVTTVSGSLTDVEVGLAANLTDTNRYIRIKSIDTGLGVLYFSENPHDLQPGDVLRIYAARFPFPWYQNVLSNGTVLMDWDISWPGEDLAMPPRVVVTPDVIVADVGESVAMVATSSAAMAVGGSLSTYTWDAGAGGAVVGSGASVSVSWSTQGFRYLSLEVTDNYGGSTTRYVPAWIGETTVPVAEASLNWRAKNGWIMTVVLSMGGSAATIAYIPRTPMALIDLETEDVLFYGWLDPESVVYDFDGDRLSMTCESILAYLGGVYSYAFLLNSVASGVADEWQEVEDLTLQRAIWALLRWRCNVHELANVDYSPTTRTLPNVEFTAGTLLQQLTTVCDSVFWEARPSRTGGLLMMTQPLYNSLFGSASSLTLDAEDVKGKITSTQSMQWISDARVQGIYPVGSTWTPLIVRAPSHPEDLGSPGEVTGLVPLNSTELRGWASRHLALSQVRTYDVDTFVDVDPWSVYRLILPDLVEISPESVQMTHDGEGLLWNVGVSGRAFGIDVTTVDEPPPPDIIIPAPDPPPVLPPLPPLPDLGWPAGVWVGTEDYGIYRSDDFTDPLQVTQPTWAADNTGLPTLPAANLTVLRFEADPASSVRQAVLIKDTSPVYPAPDMYTVYARDDAISDSTWYAVFDNDDADTLTGEAPGDCRIWDITYDATTGRLWALVSPTITLGNNVYPCYSDDNGQNWSVAATIDTLGNTYGAMINRSFGSEVIFSKAYASAGRVYYSSDGWSSFNRTDSLGGSSWIPYCYLFSNYLYSGGNPGGIGGPDLVQISKSVMTSVTKLWDSLDLGPGTPHSMVEDDTDALHQRLLKNSYLYVTYDEWATLVDETPSQLTPTTFVRIYTPVAGQPDFIFLGRQGANGTNPHIFYIMDGEDGSLIARSGPSPGTSPYTDSIPYPCGEMCGLAVRF